MIKAGFARVDVTPPLGTPLSGYFYKRESDGVLDPIQLNALAFGNGEDTAVVIACDLIGMVKEYAAHVRDLISRKTGVAADHILLCCLHQHTSIRIGDKLGVSDYSTFDDPAYMSMLYRKFCDVAQMAINDMSDAVASTAAAKALEDVAFVRRYWLEDGTVATNPSSRGPKPARRCDESDNTVRLLRFVREGKPDIAYVNFSTHPDVISGSKLSADWPGFVRRFVEKNQENTVCLCVVGFQGDSNHVDFFKSKEERFPEGERYAHSRYMGRVIADTVKTIWDKTVATEGDSVFGGMELLYTKTNTEGEELYEEQKKFYDDYEAGKFEKAPHITVLARAKRIIGIRTSPIYRTIPVSAVGFGNVLFVGIGGEPFAQYTWNAHKIAAGKTVFCSCCTNGYEGYLPHARAFREGGYEASSSPFTPVLEQQFSDTLTGILEKF